MMKIDSGKSVDCTPPQPDAKIAIRFVCLSALIKRAVVSSGMRVVMLQRNLRQIGQNTGYESMRNTQEVLVVDEIVNLKNHIQHVFQWEEWHKVLI